MKKIICCLYVLITMNCFTQNFTYKKVFATGNTLKMKGKINITDCLITIYTNNIPARFKVKKTMNLENSKQFKVIELGSDIEIRISFNNPVSPTKLNPKSLLLETKDSFSGNYTQLLYYLEDE